MIKRMTNYSDQGLRDWMVQRLTAIVIVIYCIIMLQFVLGHRPLSFATWDHWLTHPWVQISSTLAIFSVLWHARIGLWVVLTDYVKSYRLRMVLQGLTVLALVFETIWGLQVIWRL